MAKIIAHSVWQDERSPATSDPYLRLAAGILAAAIKDIAEGDIVKSLDALTFFLDDDSRVYLETLGMVLDPDQIFVKIVSGGADVNHKSAIGEPAGNGDVPDVTRSDKPLPAGIDEDASIDDIKGSQSSSKVSEC